MTICSSLRRFRAGWHGRGGLPGTGRLHLAHALAFADEAIDHRQYQPLVEVDLLLVEFLPKPLARKSQPYYPDAQEPAHLREANCSPSAAAPAKTDPATE